MSSLALDQMERFGSEGEEACFAAVSDAGYEGVQLHVEFTSRQVAACRRVGLRMAGSGRVNSPSDARLIAEKASASGFDCVTLHAGWGMEDHSDALRLLEAVLEASSACGIPLFVETHRATVFQDIWRTVQFLSELPEIRVNGDFSHWYTGLEFVYGGFEAKMRFIEPVLERVRFLHGRIGDPGSMQIDIGHGSEEGRPFVSHFRSLWTASMKYFLRSAVPGDFLCFVPELLSPRIYYARTFQRADGTLREESDRWSQSLVLCEIARSCFQLASAAEDRNLPWPSSNKVSLTGDVPQE